MITLDFDPTSFSKKEYIISGFKTYVYNSDSIEAYALDFNKKVKSGEIKKPEKIPLNVYYLAHWRCGDYSVTESIAYFVLKRYYEQADATKTLIPLICVTLDLRNHGTRCIDESKNNDWGSDNSTHGMDMASMIDGSVDDLYMIVRYLPCFIDIERYIDTKIKTEHNTQLSCRNIFSGYSMGAHVVIRFASQYPEITYMINPVIGCPQLSTLFINRLCGTDTGLDNMDKAYFYSAYSELTFLDEAQKRKYPEQLHNLLSIRDKAIFEDFQYKNIKIFACFGEKDDLVPPRFSNMWMNIYQNSNPDAQIYVEKDFGHDVSIEMLERFSKYLHSHI